MQHAASLTDLDGKPLIVLTADRNADDEWQSKQDHLATLSTNSLHRHVNATHASLLDDEADSAAASQAIHDVVAAVRTSHPLPPRRGEVDDVTTSVSSGRCATHPPDHPGTQPGKRSPVAAALNK